LNCSSMHGWNVFLNKWDNVTEKEAQSDGYANVEGRMWLSNSNFNKYLAQAENWRGS
jgi:hypothetical protein